MYSILFMYMSQKGSIEALNFLIDYTIIILPQVSVEVKKSLHVRSITVLRNHYAEQGQTLAIGMPQVGTLQAGNCTVAACKLASGLHLYMRAGSPIISHFTSAKCAYSCSVCSTVLVHCVGFLPTYVCSMYTLCKCLFDSYCTS